MTNFLLILNSLYGNIINKKFLIQTSGCEYCNRLSLIKDINSKIHLLSHSVKLNNNKKVELYEKLDNDLYNIVSLFESYNENERNKNIFDYIEILKKNNIDIYIEIINEI